MVRANRRITLEEIEDGLNEDCSHFSVHKIVSETLGYRKVSARWVDKWLKEAAGEWYNTGITKIKMEINPGTSTTKGNDNPREKELATNGKKLTTDEATRHTLATVILELTAALQGARSTQLEAVFRSATLGTTAARTAAMAAALQKIDLDPEQQLYTPKIVDIAAAVMEMHGDI
ncbi:hypothetical protein LAZ67_22000499 [Cordylochernes scorpioides]|uniref:Uncharacterized protein n=1 Tax=Cordylochernes scorpioides TaxID=51811 RepID=A0ABY6LNM8_9ARAC|nr:hypothetical protein LAZ67_22000499 [Cordylochernes scorpioides]